MTIAPNESLSRLPKGFLGNLIQVCVVSPDYKATIRRMQQAGICDCSAFTFDSRSCTDLSYYGKPADLSMKVCFGSAGTMTWEVIQPLRGPTIHQDFLDFRAIIKKQNRWLKRITIIASVKNFSRCLTPGFLKTFIEVSWILKTNIIGYFFDGLISKGQKMISA